MTFGSRLDHFWPIGIEAPRRRVGGGMVRDIREGVNCREVGRSVGRRTSRPAS